MAHSAVIFPARTWKSSIPFPEFLIPSQTCLRDGQLALETVLQSAIRMCVLGGLDAVFIAAEEKDLPALGHIGTRRNWGIRLAIIPYRYGEEFDAISSFSSEVIVTFCARGKTGQANPIGTGLASLADRGSLVHIKAPAPAQLSVKRDGRIAKLPAGSLQDAFIFWTRDAIKIVSRDIAMGRKKKHETLPTIEECLTTIAGYGPVTADLESLASWVSLVEGQAPAPPGL